MYFLTFYFLLTYKKGHKYKYSEELRKKLSLQKMGSKNPNFGKKLSEKTRKKMSVARKGGNEGSFKKGEHRSITTEFQKDQIPHNKGKIILTDQQVEAAIKLRLNGKSGIVVSKMFKVSETTLSQYVRKGPGTGLPLNSDKTRTKVGYLGHRRKRAGTIEQPASDRRLLFSISCTCID